MDVKLEIFIILFMVTEGENVVVSFFLKFIITRLKSMLIAQLSKTYRMGLWKIVVFSMLSLLLMACEDEGNSTSKSDGLNGSQVQQIFKGVVLEIKGEASLKPFDGKSRPLKEGQRVFEKSKLVSEASSSVVLTVSDGSALKMDGKSEVELDATVIESMKRKIMLKLQNGRLLFDVQKQAVKDEFEIRTEKLASIVRGTAGFMVNTDGLEASSLKEGRLEVVLPNDSLTVIASGQTLIANANGMKVVSLISSGTQFLARAIDSIAGEFASHHGVRASKISLDEMESKLLNFDEVYKKKSESFMKRTQAQFKPKLLNEYIGKPSVSLEALFIPGAYITVMGIRDTVPENGLYKRTFKWDDSTAYGSKHFVVNCSDGEVEYICHTWNTNFVSAKMAEVLTKADERKSVAAKESFEQPKKLKPAVVIEGSGRERIHVLPEERDIPATLRFSIVGLMGGDLSQIKTITLKRKGAVIKVFNGDELTENSFKIPIRLKQNRIAHFEVEVAFKKGKKIKAKKVYETYCYFDNYENGKKSNRVYDMTAEEEYKNVVSKKLLKDE